MLCCVHVQTYVLLLDLLADINLILDESIGRLSKGFRDI